MMCHFYPERVETKDAPSLLPLPWLSRHRLPPAPVWCRAIVEYPMPAARGYDEPAILSYAISSFCPTSADGLQFQEIYFRPRRRPCTDKRGHWSNVRSWGEPDTPG